MPSNPGTPPPSSKRNTVGTKARAEIFVDEKPKDRTAEGEGSATEILETAIESAPPWLFSTLLHVLVMILLALLVSRIPTRDYEIVLQPTERISQNVSEMLGDPNHDPALITSPDPENEEVITSQQDENPDPAPQPVPIEQLLDSGAAEDVPQRNPIFTLYNDRSNSEARRAAVLKGGGDETTEQAVIRGLQWLARHQYRDGHWSLRGSQFSGGSYADGISTVDNTIAATGLALLAFQGHGETLEHGEFAENVRRGWSWLVLQQDNNGCFYHFDEKISDQRFYTHGICTIAVCELYAMTRNPELKLKLRESAQKAVDYCVNTQRKTGGWRYYLNNDESDLSVTGWILLGLQSAKIAGLEVPESSLQRIGEFLDTVSSRWEDEKTDEPEYPFGSRYFYIKGWAKSRSMTAEGLLCRMFLGWPREDQRLANGMEYLVRPQNLVCFTLRDESGRLNDRDVYYWYYATQTLHHYGGTPWKKWNEVMKVELCRNQHRKNGHRDDGSWDPNYPSRDKYAAAGGRLYTTCLSIYMLEVYYRHLPLYRTIRFE